MGFFNVLDMEWITKIENNPNIRIISEYNFIENKINVTGQIRSKGSWINYTESVKTDYTGDIEDILKSIDTVYDLLIMNCNNFDCLNKLYENIKMITIADDNDE